MNDQMIMENILLTTKGACDLYMHGAVESATKSVQTAFNGAYEDSLSMQGEIFSKMTDKGWYNPKPVEQQKIDTLKQPFSAMS